MNDYKDSFLPWELRIAKRLVTEFLKERKEKISPDDFADLLQECLFHWVSVKEQYDPEEKASPQTFMWKITARKLAQIWREMESDKRKVSQQTISLSEPPDEETEDSASPLEELIGSPEEEVGVNEKQICLKIDLAKAINRLSPRQRELCAYLGNEDMGVQEISQKLQMPRGTVYDEIKRIKKVFYDNGLEEYFKKR